MLVFAFVQVVYLVHPVGSFLDYSVSARLMLLAFSNTLRWHNILILVQLDYKYDQVELL